MVCKKLVFSDRLVLYWHHIGLHEKQNDKQIQEHPKIGADDRCPSGRKPGREN